MMKEQDITLTLYITGQTPRSEQAVAHVRRLCASRWADRCTLDVIDVLEAPQRAEEDKIVATPTLIKVTPPPVRRIIGDFSQTEQVLEQLELSEKA